MRNHNKTVRRGTNGKQTLKFAVAVAQWWIVCLSVGRLCVRSTATECIDLAFFTKERKFLPPRQEANFKANFRPAAMNEIARCKENKSSFTVVSSS